MVRPSAADAVAAVEEVLATVASDRAIEAALTVRLAELPLPDHVIGQVGGVHEAAEAFRAEHDAALHRDEISQRQMELDAAREEGYRAGLGDGRAAAEAEGLELLRTLPGLVAEASVKAEASAGSLVSAVAEDLVAAALEIASWVLSREVDTDQEALLDVAAQALRDAGGVAGSQVLVAPAMGRAASRWASRFGVDRPAVVEDASVPDGTVVVRSASGGSAEVSLLALLARARESLGLPTVGPDEQSLEAGR